MNQMQRHKPSTAGLTQRQYRERHGMTQKEFSKLIGIALMTAWRYERTKRIPHPKVMRRILEKTNGEIDVASYYGNPDGK